MPIAAGVLTPLEEGEEGWIGMSSWVGIDAMGEDVWVIADTPFQGALVWRPGIRVIVNLQVHLQNQWLSAPASDLPT